MGGGLEHQHTWCLVYCATCGTDGKTKPSWSQIEWPSAPCCPLLFAKHGSWLDFVTEFLKIQPYEGLFIPGATTSCVFTAGVPVCLLAFKLCFCCAHVTLPAEFGVGHFEDPDLRPLARFLPAVLVQDRATLTAATYLRAYKYWKTWAEQHSASYLLADSVVFTLYFVSLIQQSRSVSLVNTAVYGVSWVHKKSGYREPSEYRMVKQAVEAARRILTRPRKRKEPLSADLVRRVVSRQEKGSVADIQFAALFSLVYFWFSLLG